MWYSVNYTTESIVGSFLCPDYGWTANSGIDCLYSLTHRPTLIISIIIIWPIGLLVTLLGLRPWNASPLLTMVKTWSSLVSSFPRGCSQSLWECVNSAVPSFPSRDRAWHTRSMMAQFIYVSNLTDVLTEASNWMVSANKSNGKKREENSKDYLFFFFGITFMPFSCLIPCS